MTQLDMLLYPQQPGHKGKAETSKESADKLTGRERAWARISWLLSESGPMSSDEIAAELEWDRLFARPRCSEMVALGRLVDSGERTLNQSGRRAARWKLK